MLKKIGLRVGQTPGAVAEDGGQSSLSWLGQYTSVFTKSQPQKRRAQMKKRELYAFCRNPVADYAISFGISCAAHALLIALLLLAS